MRSSIGAKLSLNIRYSREQEIWRDWDENFINDKTRHIANIVRIIFINYLDDVFEYQANLAIQRPLRFRQLNHAILKKYSGDYWWRPNNGNIKYIIRFPWNMKKESHPEKNNDNTLWSEAIWKELEAIMSMIVFSNLLSSLRK